MDQFLVQVVSCVWNSSQFSSVLSMDQFLDIVLSSQVYYLWTSFQFKFSAVYGIVLKFTVFTGSSSHVTIGWHLQENLVSVRYCCIRGWTRGGRGSKQITGYLQTNLRQNSRRFTGIHYNLVGYISQEGCIERSKMGLKSTFLR